MLKVSEKVVVGISAASAPAKTTFYMYQSELPNFIWNLLIAYREEPRWWWVARVFPALSIFFNIGINWSESASTCSLINSFDRSTQLFQLSHPIILEESVCDSFWISIWNNVPVNVSLQIPHVFCYFFGYSLALCPLSVRAGWWLRI